MSTIVGDVDLDLLLNDLGQTKQRLWVVETQLDCTVSFLRAILSKEDGEMLDAYLDNAVQEVPVELPAESRALLSALRILARVMREGSDKQVIQNICEAKPCKLDEDPLLNKSKISGKKKKASIPAGLRG